MSFTNWQTSANGFLAEIIGAAGPLTAYLATVNNPKAATAAGIVTLVATIARVWIGMIQNDSQPTNTTTTTSTTVTTPATPATTATTVVTK